MNAKVNHIPEGYHSITPYLCVKDVASAIEFYEKAFGAAESGARLTDPEGKVLHAEIEIGDSKIMLTDEFQDYGALSPETLGGSPVRMALYVEDADALTSQAVAAGAKVVIPVQDQFYGDRSGRLEDPFGYAWIISTHIEDMSSEEMQMRAAALYGES